MKWVEACLRLIHTVDSSSVPVTIPLAQTDFCWNFFLFHLGSWKIKYLTGKLCKAINI